MGLLDIFRASGSLYLNPDETEQAWRNEVRELESRVISAEESLLEIADAFDNIGWSGGMEPEEVREMPLATVKRISSIARAVTTQNPFVKRGVDARIGYIWGSGFELTNVKSSTKKQVLLNQKRIFSSQAYEEFERALATDGNVFRAVSSSNKPMIRIPLEQIAGRVSNPDNIEEIWYYKREWSKRSTKFDDGAEDTTTQVKYYPSISYAKQLTDDGKNLPKVINGIGIDQDYVMQHIAVNKQIGWAWGVPDVLSVLFFAKVYKEYLEDSVSLHKAYGQLAYQVQTPNAGTANAVSAAFSSMPQRDPITGESRRVGGTAVTNSGTSLAPIGLNASSVDFNGGEPLAAAIAAGLGIEKSIILAEPIAGAVPPTTLKTIISRQEIWADVFTELFEFWDDSVTGTAWGQIDADETHRRIQSVQLAYDGGQLFQDEARAETLKGLNIVSLHPDGELPTSMTVTEQREDAEKLAEKTQQAAAKTAQIAAANPAPVAVNAATPGQGNKGAAGSMNQGADQVKAAAKKSMVTK